LQTITSKLRRLLGLET